MRLSIALLGSVGTASALSISARPVEKRQSEAVDPNDFVYVDGLRLKDAKGLHYITVRARIAPIETQFLFSIDHRCRVSTTGHA